MTDEKQIAGTSTALDKEAIFAALSLAVEQQNQSQIVALSSSLHPADIAEFLQQLGSDARNFFIEAIRPNFDPEILAELEPELIEEITDTLGTQQSAEILAQLDSDVVVEFVEELEEKEQQEIIDALPAESRAAVEEGLSYPEDSVGRLMRKKFVTVPEYWNVGQVLDYLRSQDDLPDDFHVIYVVDPKHRPLKFVLTSRIMRNKREVQITDIAQECKNLIAPETDQEEAAFIFHKYGLVSLAVINQNGRIIGVLTEQDIVEVIQEESQEDIMRLAGVNSADLYRKIYKVVGKRTPWLIISAVNAFIASFVIMQFSESIKAIVTLAALSPMVAGLSGNAGSQALTVTVSAIVKRTIGKGNSTRFIGREMIIGLFNGLIVASVAATGVFFVHHSVEISAIFGASIVCCFVAAGTIGSGIPILLRRFGFDPTVASSAFVTAMTDILSFSVFLGLSTALLL